MRQKNIQKHSHLIKIKLLPRLTLIFAIVSGLLMSVFISIYIRLEKQNFDNWLDKSMYSSLDAIDIIYASTKNDDYDVEYVWGKLMSDFDQLGFLENRISPEELNNLKQNLTANIEKTIFASFNFFIRHQRFQVKGFPFVVSQKGDVLVHPIDEGENYSDNLFFQGIISSNTAWGQIEMRWPENRLGEKRKLYYKKNENNGYFAFINLSMADYVSNLSKYKKNIIIYGLGTYILILLLFLFVVRPIILSIQKNTKNTSQLLSEHKLEDAKFFFDDEINSAYNTLKDGQRYLHHLIGFIGQLKKQVYNTELPEEYSKKALAKEISELTDNLVKIQHEEDKRKKELDLQNWIATGIAKFNDILRKSINLQEMGYDIVSSLCDYMKINQAAIYIVERNELSKELETIRLIAAYAFDRNRHINKTLEPGEGLVGAAIKETKRIYLDNVPENYIHITSGLGESVPTYLLIIPLKQEEEILGALELASFNKIEDHEIEFLERLAATFAVSISNILVSDNTNRLLNETKEQAEQMASQEEEMRQTLEELQATQEEMRRKTSQMEDMNRRHEEKEKELEDKITELEKKEVELKNQVRLRDLEIEKLKNL